MSILNYLRTTLKVATFCLEVKLFVKFTDTKTVLEGII